MAKASASAHSTPDPTTAAPPAAAQNASAENAAPQSAFAPARPPLNPGPPPFERPYFMPKSVDFEALPEDVQIALLGIVGPAYEDFVNRARTPMERTAGVTLVFVLTMEVIEQFKVARITDFSTLASLDEVPETSKLLGYYLRLATMKQNSARFMHRLHRSRPDPLTATLRQPPPWPTDAKSP